MLWDVTIANKIYLKGLSGQIVESQEVYASEGNRKIHRLLGTKVKDRRICRANLKSNIALEVEDQGIYQPIYLGSPQLSVLDLSRS